MDFFQPVEVLNNKTQYSIYIPAVRKGVFSKHPWVTFHAQFFGFFFKPNHSKRKVGLKDSFGYENIHELKGSLKDKIQHVSSVLMWRTYFF